MRYLKFGLLLTAIAVVAVVAINQDCSINSKTSNQATTQEELNKQFPGEWFYNERAYPNNYINRDAIKEAELQAKSILANRNAGGSWILNGPINTGGRITDLAISPTDDDTFYAAAASGGIFRTTDGGANFEPIFDDQTKLSIGDLAIAPSNSQVIYAGTGEANGSVNTGAFFGDGIYRSNDAGDTWTNIGLEESEHIGRIVVDPSDEDRVFVAAAGKLYGYNTERGVYRTTDGGNNWDQVLFVNDSTAAIDVAINNANPDIIYAAMWERTRKPWIRDYGGIESAIHRSTDGGDTWEQLGAVQGLPAPDGQTGRIGLAVSVSDPSTVYASFTTNQITNVFNGLYKSTDNGDNWALVALNDIQNVNSSFGWYFGNLRINPTDPEEVHVLGQQLVKTNDSGSNWTTVSGMHVDHHAMEYSLNNNDFMLAGNDGGLYRSTNGGNTWQKFINLPITQFYNIEVDFQDPLIRYGGTQDNNTIRTANGSTSNWSSVWGGDGFQVNIDPVANNFVYVESQFGNLAKSSDGGNNFSLAKDGIDGNDRNNWNTPVEISNFDSEILYYGTNRLYSSNRATFWTAISPDLTDGQHPSGSLSYGTLTTIQSSFQNNDVIYTGSDDGKLHVTNDGGATWDDISAGLPDRYITSIAVSPSDDQTVYVGLSGYLESDYDPHLFKSTNGGQTWTAIANNLPNIPVNDIVVNSDESLLFVATDLNVWYSQNDGASWSILGNNLPLTLTRDLKFHEPSNTLYAGTYGRSMWSYDTSQIILNTPDNALEASLVLYPNPATDQIAIQHSLDGNGSITVYDISGKIIKTWYQGELSNLPASFSIAEMSTGVYFVRLNTGAHQVTKKLVVL